VIRLSTSGFGLPQIHTRGLGVIGFLYADSFWVALRAYIQSIGELSDLTEVYFRQTPPRFALPCLIYTPISDTPELNNSDTFWERSTVQFAVLANDDVTADRIGLQLYKSLSPKMLIDGQEYARARIKAFDSYEMAAIPGLKIRATQSGRGPGNKNVWAFHCQFTFLVGRSMVSQ